MDASILQRFTDALGSVDEIAALVLGGSRARGMGAPGSDYDLGLYYEASAPLDIEKLREAVRPLVDDPAQAEVTAIGGWGPWINGGGWLTVSGKKVDLLYRDLGQVASVIAGCRAGRISMDYQPGHPHGFCSAIWMAEVAQCQPLFDRTGALGRLKAQTVPFPEGLRRALIGRFHWEVTFSIDLAEKAIGRQEQTYFAGSTYRALCCVAQVLFALNGRYLVNEKGALGEAETFPIAMEHLAETTGKIWAAVATRELGVALELLRGIAKGLDQMVQCSPL
jgi:hypothetical protein